jgi:hypothetical protein
MCDRRGRGSKNRAELCDVVFGQPLNEMTIILSKFLFLLGRFSRLFFWNSSHVHLGHRNSGCWTVEHHDWNVFRTICHGRISGKPTLISSSGGNSVKEL